VPNPLATSVRKSAVWNAASTMLLRLFGIGITAIVARILTPHDFGVFAVATTAFTIISALGEFGAASCIVRADLDANALVPTMWTVSFATSFALAAVMVLYAKQIATALGSADAVGPVRVMAITVILVGVASVPTAQCTRDFKQGTLFLANALSFVPSTIVLIVMARSGSGAMAFAWSRVAGQLTSCLILLAASSRLYLPGVSRYGLSVLCKFGVPWAAASFVGFILQNVDYALIGHLMGAARLGVYVLAFNVASWPSALLMGIIYAVSMPTFSRVRHDAEKLMEVMADSVRAVVLIAAPMCAFLMVLARPLVLTLYGARWVAAANVLSILCLYGLISIICVLFSSMVAALGKPNFILIVQLLWLGLLIPAMAIGVYRAGIDGAAIAHLVVLVPFVLPCYLIALRRATGVNITRLAKAAFPLLVVTSIAAFIAWWVASLVHGASVQLVAGLVAGGMFYLLATAPQLILVLGRDRAGDPRVRRVMRPYYRMARVMGIQMGPPPRHARRTRAW
jgi:lipopolysaccharide exporter